MGTSDSLFSAEALVTAVLQTFAIVFVGAVVSVAGLSVKGNKDGWAVSHGLAKFVAIFTLPAAVFRALANVTLADVNGPFLAAATVAKAFTALVVILATVALSPEGRRKEGIAKAGANVLFTTQSNDLAIGKEAYRVYAALGVYDTAQGKIKHLC